MKLPYSWLAELVENLPPADVVADQLIMLGFEVEDVEEQGAGIGDVIVAELLERNPHPDADKLSVCRVNDGGAEHTIVCGADNMQAGDYVALARVGSVLPGDFKIEKRKIRGQASSGMMCSSRELGLGDDHSGIMILPKDYGIGNRLVDEMGMNDAIFDISITPNRPDALNAIGIARELAARNKSNLNLPKYNEMAPDEQPDFSPSITIEAEDNCFRYAGLVMTGLSIGPSPDWLKNRLEACGIRSINNIVDATNYVLMEMGQPLHAFDYEKLEDKRIIVRQANSGEVITTLDEEKRELQEHHLVIADAKNAVAVAGVMGGLDSEVTESTTTLLLESAYFNPSSIHKTEKQLKLPSEASYRFERGVDFETVIPAVWRCANLIAELAGGKVVGKMTITDTANKKNIEDLQGHSQSINVSYCQQILGKDFSADDIEGYLTSVGFTTESKDANRVTVRVPSYRNDVQYPADLAEEVARCYGYDRFESTLPMLPARPPERQEISHNFINRLRDILTANGLDECITYSFSDHETLKAFTGNDEVLSHPLTNLENPISPRESTMRSSIVPSLLLAAQRNVSYFNNNFGLFEVGRAYLPQEGEYANEINRVAGIIIGNPLQSWSDTRSELDFFAVKGIAENVLKLGSIQRYRQAKAPDWLHPKRSVSVQMGKEIIGCYGELHPNIAEQFNLSGRVGIFEIDLKPLYENQASKTPQMKQFSNFPAVKRDFALLVPKDVSTKKIEDCITQNAKNLLEEVRIFDYYQGKQVQEGMVSAAFRVAFRSTEGTLKEEIVDETCNAILNALEKKLKVVRRS